MATKKYRKSMKAATRCVSRWVFRWKVLILFRKAAELEHLQMMVARMEQLVKFLLNCYASENRSKGRTNWNEEAEMEQDTEGVKNFPGHMLARTIKN